MATVKKMRALLLDTDIKPCITLQVDLGCVERELLHLLPSSKTRNNVCT